MNETYIRTLLDQVSAGELTSGEAYEQLKDLPYKDMGFANIDHHRSIRTGFPEVIFGQGKTPQQIRDIFVELVKYHRTVIATRATAEAYDTVRQKLPAARYYEMARIIAVDGNGAREAADPADGSSEGGVCGSVCVVSAGTADMPVAEEAAVTAELMGNRVSRVYDVGVAGIHRLLDKLPVIRQADVVITVAGMEGALASVIGGLVDVPVIAVPTSIGYGANLGGLSALLSMLNSCANGVSVVNIDNGFGAAYMSSMINRRHRDRG